MTILCLDTATERGLVAVARDGGVCASVRWRSAGRHGENLLGYIESSLSQAGLGRRDLSAIGVVTGPGGFTSLRVGLATAKGLALGLGLPIVGVGSLRVMARAIDAPADSVLVPVMEGYRGEVFAAAYVMRRGVLEEIAPPRSGNLTDVLQEVRKEAGDRSISVWNPAMSVTPEALAVETIVTRDTHGPADLASLEPQYFRASDAQLPERPIRTTRT
jgi:tRNA threonylcarbamoyl adenosine modification protein YeaZ